MTGRSDEMVDLLKKALFLNPDYVHAHHNLGNAFKQRGEIEAAIACYQTALRLKPDYPEAFYNLSLVLQEQGSLDAAIAGYVQAVRLKPDYAEAYHNLARAYKERGDLPAAIVACKAAIQLRPDGLDARWSLALALLLAGDYSSGWKQYDHRLTLDVKAWALHARPRCPLWDGVLPGPEQKLLLVAEQGLGDTLQFMRYLLPLRRAGVKVSLCAQTKLHGLIKASGIDPAPLSPDQANAVSDGHWLPLLSIPGRLGVSPDRPIISASYISTPPDLQARWKRSLATERRPIIGINWQGNPGYETVHSVGRSLSLQAFAPIALRTKASLLSLQKGFGSEQLQTCSFRSRFVACQSQVDDSCDFLETAALISQCDLVITSDTAVAHLAGGLGQPTWLLLQKVPEWRWGLEGDTTFWYPSMRLFRQKQRGDWNEVIERVAAELARLDV